MPITVGKLLPDACLGPVEASDRTDRLLLDEALPRLRAVPRDARNVEILEAVFKVEALVSELTARLKRHQKSLEKRKTLRGLRGACGNGDGLDRFPDGSPRCGPRQRSNLTL